MEPNESQAGRSIEQLHPKLNEPLQPNHLVILFVVLAPDGLKLRLEFYLGRNLLQ